MLQKLELTSCPKNSSLHNDNGLRLLLSLLDSHHYIHLDVANCLDTHYSFVNNVVTCGSLSLDSTLDNKCFCLINFLYTDYLKVFYDLKMHMYIELSSSSWYSFLFLSLPFRGALFYSIDAVTFSFIRLSTISIITLFRLSILFSIPKEWHKFVRYTPEKYQESNFRLIAGGILVHGSVWMLQLMYFYYTSHFYFYVSASWE